MELSILIPDKRGIDVALLYQNNISDQRRILILLIKKAVKKQWRRKTDDTLQISNYNNRVFTRDQLLVTGFDGEEINIIVNHPSRRWREKSSPLEKQQELWTEE
jgi:hypothetical protein